jgi:hypothetical protein
MDVNIYHHIVQSDEKLDRILALLGKIQLGVKTMATDLTALESQVAQTTTAEQSAVLLLTQLHDLLLSAQNDPVKLNELISQLAVSKEALAAAVVINTPST